MIVQTFYNEVT